MPPYSESLQPQLLRKDGLMLLPRPIPTSWDAVMMGRWRRVLNWALPALKATTLRAVGQLTATSTACPRL